MHHCRHLTLLSAHLFAKQDCIILKYAILGLAQVHQEDMFLQPGVADVWFHETFRDACIKARVLEVGQLLPCSGPAPGLRRTTMCEAGHRGFHHKAQEHHILQPSIQRGTGCGRGISCCIVELRQTNSPTKHIVPRGARCDGNNHTMHVPLRGCACCVSRRCMTCWFLAK